MYPSRSSAMLIERHAHREPAVGPVDHWSASCALASMVCLVLEYIRAGGS
jgi:hypothetical protein